MKERGNKENERNQQMKKKKYRGRIRRKKRDGKWLGKGKKGGRKLQMDEG